MFRIFFKAISSLLDSRHHDWLFSLGCALVGCCWCCCVENVIVSRCAYDHLDVFQFGLNFFQMVLPQLIDVIDFIGTGIAERRARGPRPLNNSSQGREGKGIATVPAGRFNVIGWPVFLVVTPASAVAASAAVGRGGGDRRFVLGRHQL